MIGRETSRNVIEVIAPVWDDYSKCCHWCRCPRKYFLSGWNIISYPFHLNSFSYFILSLLSRSLWPLRMDFWFARVIVHITLTPLLTELTTHICNCLFTCLFLPLHCKLLESRNHMVLFSVYSTPHRVSETIRPSEITDWTSKLYEICVRSYKGKLSSKTQFIPIDIIKVYQYQYVTN